MNHAFKKAHTLNCASRIRGLCGLKLLMPGGLRVLGIIRIPGLCGLVPLSPWSIVTDVAICADELVGGKTISRHLRTRSFALFARASLLVWRRSSLMCLPSRVICSKCLAIRIVGLAISYQMNYD